MFLFQNFFFQLKKQLDRRCSRGAIVASFGSYPSASASASSIVVGRTVIWTQKSGVER
jgi:hypothetical protein